jgi:hypothetical protein
MDMEIAADQQHPCVADLDRFLSFFQSPSGTQHSTRLRMAIKHSRIPVRRAGRHDLFPHTPVSAGANGHPDKLAFSQFETKKELEILKSTARICVRKRTNGELTKNVRRS